MILDNLDRRLKNLKPKIMDPKLKQMISQIKDGQFIHDLELS